LQDNAEPASNQLVEEYSPARCAQGRAQIPDAACPDPAKVVAVWSKLPAPLKAAILAIVNSTFPVAPPSATGSQQKITDNRQGVGSHPKNNFLAAIPSATGELTQQSDGKMEGKVTE
jgi:hypothetical protein